MRKLFKKALACCLVAALALTCFVGALSVNAETAAALTGKIEVGTVEVANDATTATVPVVITSDNALNAAKITVAASEGWEVSAIAIDAASTAAKIEADNINGDTFIVEAFDNVAGFTTATVNVTFTSKAAVAATITATLDPVHAATWNEDVVNLAVTDGAITVKAAEPECDHANAELVYSVVDGNCVTTKVCDCGNEEEIASVANPKFGHAPVLEADLTLIFRVPTTNVETYSNVEAIFTKTLYDGNADVVDTLPLEDYDLDATKKQFTYCGIVAKEMSSNINVKVFGNDAAGNRILLATEDYSMVTYINSAYTSYTKNLVAGSKKEANLKLIVDLANYGAAAQTKFGYNTANLADAGLDDSYGSAEVTSFNQVEMNATGVTFNRAPDLDNKVLVKVRFPRTAVNDTSKIVINYVDTAGTNLEREIIASDFEEYDATRYQITYDNMFAATMSKAFTVTLYTDGANVGQFTYSMENYAKSSTDSSKTDADTKALVRKLIAYGRSADAFFNYGK